MRFNIHFLSFYVLQSEGKEGQTYKQSKHYQTLDEQEYEESEIKKFIHAEFARIAKRKVEKNPTNEEAPTKLGTFVVEPGHELSTNPNYNLFMRLRTADQKDDFQQEADELVRSYLETAAVRGGAMIIAQAGMDTHFDDPFVFVIKCDFEQQIARISDEKSLISEVEMAISSRNIKSIQYPHMPEEGMIEEWELKVHQSSHARYFEDFLKFVTYEQSIPEMVTARVMNDVQSYLEEKWPDENSEERQQEEHDLELWAASSKRDLQEKWDPQQVMHAAERIVEIKPEIEIRLKLGDTFIKGLLADFGHRLHITKLGDQYAVVIEGDSFTFEKGFLPVELLQPDSFEKVSQQLIEKAMQLSDTN